MAGFDQGAALGDVDQGRMPARPDSSSDSAPNTDDRSGAGDAALFTVRYDGFHRFNRALNLSTRIRPVSPNTLIAYWTLRPLMYTVPDEQVPIGENDIRLLGPTRIGFDPGGAPPSIPG